MEEGKAGTKAGEAGRSGQAGPGVAQVSFLTAALMGVALCFHSILEVCVSLQHPCSAAVLLDRSVYSCRASACIWVWDTSSHLQAEEADREQSPLVKEAHRWATHAESSWVYALTRVKIARSIWP